MGANVATLKGFDHTEVHAYNRSSSSSSSSSSIVNRKDFQSTFSDLPGLIRDDSSFTSAGSSDDESMPSNSSQDSVYKPKRKGVSFGEDVMVQPVPHSSALTYQQRRKMYASSSEVRQNKQRNKKEYRYEGCDWRNATEEWEMSVDMITGELVHPAHDICNNN